MILTILIFIIILGLLVFVHELGHFLTAKRNGIRVDEFGFGFPPRIFSIKKGETVYSINAIPLGGFVKIYGEEGEGETSPRSFISKSAWTKSKILFAGVLMNFLLAILLFSIGSFIGLPTAIGESEITKYPNAQLQLINVAQNSPASSAGLLAGDFVVALKDLSGQMLTQIKTPSRFQDFVDNEKGKEIIVTVKRGSEKLEIAVTPRANPPQGQGPLGVELATVAQISSPWYRALLDGFLTAISFLWFLILTLYEILRNLFITGRAGVEVTGPVGIFNLTGQAVTLGLVYILQLAAMLSINLAVINAIPFPALDGGRALFLLIEKIKGSPIKMRTAGVVNTIGFALLIALMIFITFKDITRII